MDDAQHREFLKYSPEIHKIAKRIARKYHYPNETQFVNEVILACLLAYLTKQTSNTPCRNLGWFFIRIAYSRIRFLVRRAISTQFDKTCLEQVENIAKKIAVKHSFVFCSDDDKASFVDDVAELCRNNYIKQIGRKPKLVAKERPSFFCSDNNIDRTIDDTSIVLRDLAEAYHDVYVIVKAQANRKNITKQAPNARNQNFGWLFARVAFSHIHNLVRSHLLAQFDESHFELVKEIAEKVAARGVRNFPTFTSFYRKDDFICDAIMECRAVYVKRQASKKPIRNFRAFFRKITENKFKLTLRKIINDRKNEDKFGLVSLEALIEQATDEPDKKFVSDADERDVIICVRCALAGNPKLLEVMELKITDRDITDPEIAEILKIPVSTVKYYIRRARQVLRNAGLYDEYAPRLIQRRQINA